MNEYIIPDNVLTLLEELRTQSSRIWYAGDLYIHNGDRWERKTFNYGGEHAGAE